MQQLTLEHDADFGSRYTPPPPAPRRPQRRRRRRRRRNDPVRSALVAVATGALLCILLAVPVIIFLVWVTNTAEAMIADVPNTPQRLERAPERSVVVDRNGKRLATLQVENRIVVDLDEIPDHVVNAVLATEDQSFWEHQGVNWGAVIRSALRLAAAGEVEGGGSTITQQVVKNRFIGAEQSLNRKIVEAAMAAQIERRIGKKQILQTYLNDTYFGNGVYGIATAAEYYWSKSVDELTIDEAALLAGIIRSPERNNPVDAPDKAIARRNIVLDQMAEEGVITPKERDKAKKAELNLDIKRLKSRGSPFLIDIIRRELEADPELGDTPEERWATVLRGGLRIRTTLHAGLQRAAEKTIKELLPRKKKDPLASIVAVDPATGEVLAAAVGPKKYGEGPGKTTVNPTMPGLGSEGRPSGSTFKMFEIVAALEHEVSPTHLFTSGPTYRAQHPACAGHEFTNYGGSDLGTLDMAAATAKSSNTYFIHLLEIAGGPEAMIDVAKRMGISSDIEPHCAAVLGSENVFPVDMATAFATLANDGKRCKPHTIRAIRDTNGDVIRKGRGKCKQVIDEEIAHATTALLQGPINHGTASQHGQIGRPAAGKTGTTTDNKDAWFAGYIPQLAAATWVGHEIPKTLYHPACGEVTGGCLPTMLWQRFMVKATDILDLPVEEFPEPPPPPTREVPSVTGMPQEQASEILIEAGFIPAVEEVGHEAPAGTVVEQSPGAGEQVPEATTVTIKVSNGQPPMDVPSPPTHDGPPRPDGPDFPDFPDFPGPGERPTSGPGPDIPGPGTGGDGTGDDRDGSNDGGFGGFSG